MDQGMGNNSYGKGSDTKMTIDNKDKERMLPTIIAVDFDGTLVENKYPEIGEINQTVWQAVLAAQNSGVKLILWTSRTEEFLDDAVQFCKQNGLVFDAINDNIDEVKALGWNARKVFATMYVDDRSAWLAEGAFEQMDKWVLFG